MKQKITEEQLRSIVYKTIKESLEEEGIDEWRPLDNLLARGRRAMDNIGSKVGGAAAGLKGAFQGGLGSNAFNAAKGDYMAKRNQELGAERLQQQKDAIAKFNQEYNQKLSELNKWAGAERAKIRNAYGVDVYNNMAKSGAEGAEKARQAQRQLWAGNQSAAQGNVNNTANNAEQGGTRRMTAESIEKIVGKVLRESIG